MTRTSRFISGFLITACVGVIVNALPYFLTRRAYQHDGQEVAGFPYYFHKVGGDCWPETCQNYNFSLNYFVLDLAIAFACAVAVGLIAARVGAGRRSATDHSSVS